MRLGSLGSETVVPVSLEHLDSGRPFSVHKLLQKLISRGFSDFNRAERDFLLSFNYRDPFRLHGSTWLLAAQQWRFNLQYLQDTFRLRRYDALVHPGMRTYRPLIHLRQLIVDMRDQLPKAYSQSLHHTSYQEEHSNRDPPSLFKVIAQVMEDLGKLDKELNDEIHLIIGAVTVQDSDANKTQTERATLLTLLAAVYLPLTLVTGIFGMNIREVDEGKPTWWACVIVLAVVAACTVAFYLAYRHLRAKKRAREEEERMEAGFQKDV